MKRTKICAIFLTVAVALLLATCSDGADQGEFATVTISLGNSEASRVLVQVSQGGSSTTESHHYKIIVKDSTNPNNSTTIENVTTSDGRLIASGVPIGKG